MINHNQNTLDDANFLNQQGKLHYQQGKLVEALYCYQKSLNIREKLAPDSLLLAASYNNIGAIYGAQGKLKEALPWLKKSLDIKERLESNSLADSYNNIGNIYNLKGEIIEALKYYKKSLAIEEKLAPNSLACATCYSNIGKNYCLQGKLIEAFECHQKALSILEKLAPNNMAIADSYNNIGEVYRAQNKLTDAIKYYKKSLAIQEKLAPNSLDTAGSYNNLGIAYSCQNIPTTALKYHHKSLAIRQRLSPDSFDTAGSYSNIGSVYYFQGNLKEALAYHQRSLAITEILAPDSISTAASYNKMGDIYHFQGRLKEALNLYKKAFKIKQRSSILFPPELETLSEKIAAITLPPHQIGLALPYTIIFSSENLISTHLAAQRGDLETIKKLISKGEDINQEAGDNGETPLYIAASNGHLEVVRELIAAKADINKATADDKTTPLYIATQNGHLEIIEELTAKGANVNQARDNNGATPLYIAAQLGYFTLVKLLINKGADVNQARTDNGATPFYIAAERGHLDIVKEMINKGADINKARIDYKTTALHMAVYNGDLKMVKELIIQGADVNLAAENKETPLYLAIQEGHFEITKELIIAKADINKVTNCNDSTLLLNALIFNHLNIAELLISHGANVNNSSALAYFSFFNKKEIVKFLLKYNIEIEEEAILIAQRYSSKDIFYLLKNKLRSNIITNLVKERIDKFADLIDKESSKKKDMVSKIIKNDLTNISIKIDESKSTLDKDGNLIFLFIKTIMTYQKKDKTIKEFTLELKLYLNQEDFNIIALIDNQIIKKLVEELGRGKEFIKVNNSLKPQDKIIEKEAAKKLTKEEFNFLKLNIKKRLEDLTYNFIKPSDIFSDKIDILRKKIIHKLEKSITTENKEDSLQEVINSFALALLKTYQIDDNIEDKDIEILIIIKSYQSIIINEIRAKKMSLPNQVQIDKLKKEDGKKDQILLQITKAERFIEEIILLIKAEQSYIIDDLKALLANIQIDNLNQEQELKQINRKVNYLEKISKLDTYKPKTTIAITSNQILIKEDRILLAKDQKYEVTDLIKALPSKFVENNLTEPDIKQLNLLRNNLLALQKEEKLLDEFFIAIINNLVNSDNFLAAARRIAIIIKNVAFEEKKEELIQNLWQYQNYSKIIVNDINKIAEFFVGIDFIQNQAPDLSTLSIEQIQNLVAKVKSDLEENNIINNQITDDQFKQTFVNKVSINQEDKIIKQFLSNLIAKQEFVTTLCYTPHGTKKSKPYITRKTSQDLIKENLITTKQDLEERLESNNISCSEELLTKINQIIINNLSDSFKKKGSGSHNFCFKIPKILPHKGSPLSDEEKKLYIKRLKNLEALLVLTPSLSFN
jgi:ankyrin repeat protein/Tfp pilus assembly protein PilF